MNEQFNFGVSCNKNTDTCKWYTLEELAKETGYASANALLANEGTSSVLSRFNTESNLRVEGPSGKHTGNNFLYNDTGVQRIKEFLAQEILN